MALHLFSSLELPFLSHVHICVPTGNNWTVRCLGFDPPVCCGTDGVGRTYHREIFFCGWACPFGFLQELIYKVPYVKFNIPAWTRYIKYIIFAALVVAVPVYLTPESTLYFCRLCPAGTIQSAIPWAIINGTTDIGHLALRLGILFAIIILAMGHRRFFCKVICPLGAFLSLFNRFALIFPERKESCVDCGVCNKLCPMETKPKSEKYGVFDKKPEECITCLECQKKCPTHSVQLWG